VVAAALLAVTAAACDGGNDGDTAPTATGAIAVLPTTTVPARVDDGRLTIGLLLPRRGEGAAMGQSMADAANSAILGVNAVGGVRGEPVVVEVADEGETATEAADAMQQLIDEGVDAVVGPASSTSALAHLDLLLDNDVLTCSPSATALALDDYPDRDLFVRTAPSDSLQATGLAQLAEQTGRTTLAVTWLDDVYGRPLAEETLESLRARSATIDVVDEVPFAADGSLEETAARIAAAKPGVVIVIADADHGGDLLPALSAAVAADPSVETPDIILNDTMRIPNSPSTIAGLPAEFRSRIQGLAPVAEGPDDVPGAFATNAFDCATLIALAAHQVGPDDTLGMREAINELSTRGGACRDFGNCVQALAGGRNIDYEGPSGPVQIGPDGDPERARYDIFRFTDEGVDRTERQFTVTRVP